MGLAMRLTAGSHVLHVSESELERFALFEHLVSNVARRGRRLVAHVDPKLASVFETAIRLAALRSRQVSLNTIGSGTDGAADDASSGHPGWKALCESIDASVRTAERHSVAWRRDESESETLLYVDLDPVFRRCESASEMMSVIYSLHHNQAAARRCVVESVTIGMIPRSIPTDFFDVHTDWVFASPATGGFGEGASLDLAAQRVALATPEFRHQFLALARTDPAGAQALVPRILRDYRRGFLLVDERLQVRFCSARAAGLLGREAAEIVGRPVNTCIDGVDFVTLKHECARVSGGDQSPFVVSWRLAPGVYEPREVTVDAVTSEHRAVGYVISIASVETVRGPRAAYRQLSEESPQSAAAVEGDDLDPEENLNESLHGTQITRREHEVLLLILRDRSNREIAGHLNIAEVTVKKHLTSIYRKLRITNRSELMRSFASPNTDHRADDGMVE